MGSAWADKARRPTVFVASLSFIRLTLLPLGYSVNTQRKSGSWSVHVHRFDTNLEFCVLMPFFGHSMQANAAGIRSGFDIVPDRSADQKGRRIVLDEIHRL